VQLSTETAVGNTAWQACVADRTRCREAHTYLDNKPGKSKLDAVFMQDKYNRQQKKP
jgi:hypothetical protein